MATKNIAICKNCTATAVARKRLNEYKPGNWAYDGEVVTPCEVPKKWALKCRYCKQDTCHQYRPTGRKLATLWVQPTLFKV